MVNCEFDSLAYYTDSFLVLFLLSILGMKKIVALCISFGVFLSTLSFAQDLEWSKNFYYGNTTPVSIEVDAVTDTENIPEMIRQWSVKADKTLLNSLLSIFWFWENENNNVYTGEGKALIYIRFIINLLLWLVSFIALVMIIYSFYLMFFTENTQGMETVKKNLKGVAIALVVLGLSWIIVSFIFNFYQENLLVW